MNKLTTVVILILANLNIQKVKSFPIREFPCLLCEYTQQTLLQTFEKYEYTLFPLVNRICTLKYPFEFCEYWILNDGKILINKQKEFIRKTNYLCANKLGLCPLIYKDYSFQNYRNHIFNLKAKTSTTNLNSSVTNKQKNLENQKLSAQPVKSDLSVDHKIHQRIKNKIVEIGGNYPNLKILVLTDIHIDPDYKIGSNGECDAPGGCCNGDSGPVKKEEHRAGYWGFNSEYSKCDIPYHFWEKTLKYLKKLKEKGEIDLVISLGDIHSHSFYKVPESTVINANNHFIDTLKKTFEGVQVIPVLGNHETNPMDNYDFKKKDNFTIKNIFNRYKEFVGEQKINDLIEKGFYEWEIKDRNIKFISINSQNHDNYNFTIMDDNVNLQDFFENIAAALLKSEQQGQKVILLQHIPPNDLYGDRSFQKNWTTLVERFADTIIGQFAGHSHFDQVRFFRDQKNEKITGVNFISPSVTTFDSFNPSFRIYEFEGGSFKDYHQYRFDLRYHNALVKDKQDYSFRFDKAYSFSNQYGVKTLGNENYMQDFFNAITGEKKKEYILNYLTKNFEEDVMRRWDYVWCMMQNGAWEQAVCLRKHWIFNIGYEAGSMFSSVFNHPWIVKIE